MSVVYNIKMAASFFSPRRRCGKSVFLRRCRFQLWMSYRESVNQIQLIHVTTGQRNVRISLFDQWMVYTRNDFVKFEYFVSISNVNAVNCYEIVRRAVYINTTKIELFENVHTLSSPFDTMLHGWVSLNKIWLFIKIMRTSVLLIVESSNNYLINILSKPIISEMSWHLTLFYTISCWFFDGLFF